MEGGGLGLSGLLTMGPQSLIRGKSELIGFSRLCSGVAFEGESLLFPLQHGGFNVFEEFSTRGIQKGFGVFACRWRMLSDWFKV